MPGDAGCQAARQVLGLTPERILTPHFHQIAWDRIKKLTDEGGSVSLMGQHIVRLDGSIVIVETSAAAYTDGHDKLIVVILRDVSDRKAAEQQLRQAQKMEAIGQLTGGIAHDFNNLLSIMVGNLDLLAEHVKGDPTASKLVGDSLTGALRGGAELTQRLLAFARQQPLQPAVINLNERLPEISDMLRRTLEEMIALT